MNTLVKGIITKALDGEEIAAGEIKELFRVPVISEEAYAIQYAARKMTEETAGGRAEVHAQVGINVAPCPQNCVFCSFAARNAIFQHSKAMPPEEVIERCLAFEGQGANAIYLMATANFPFEEFLRFGRQVREALQPDTVLIANIGDFDDEGAIALRKAGFNGIYHAIRLGEGAVTGIKPERRLQTVRAARRAGLLVGTCVEPVGPEHTLDELVEKTLLTREMRPVFSGAARRIAIPGTDLAGLGMVSEARMALILAVVRLAVGRGVSFNCTHEPNGIGAMAGANLFWAENGANPRDPEEKTENNRGYTVAKCREILREAGWELVTGPSRAFQTGCSG
ncbi:MAG: biotin synthase [Moorella sp. (in: firmicutes)]|nr:biotin synthase [Moorella sp. (in: firmicutes)]